MYEKTLRVKYLSNKNNFCYLNPALTKQLGPNAVVRLLHDNNIQLHFSVSPEYVNVRDDYIGLSSLYAKLLELEENEFVTISQINCSCKVQSFTIYPIQYDDFHVLDLLKNEVENCVLTQTKVVSVNQELIIWIAENISIPVKISSVSPTSPGILNNLTELIILPHLRKIEKAKESNENNVISNEENGMANKLNIDIFDVPPKLTDQEIQIEKKLQLYCNKKDSLVGRLVSFNCLKSSKNIEKYFYEFNIFLSNSIALSSWKKKNSFEDPIFCSLEVVSSEVFKKIIVRVFIIDDLEYVGIIKNNIFVHDSLFSFLDCSIGASVYLKVITKYYSNHEIIIRRKDDGVEQIEELIREYLANLCKKFKFVLNANFPILLNDNNVLCSLKFKPPWDYCLVDEDFLRDCTYTVEDGSSLNKLAPIEALEIKNLIEFDGQKIIIDNLIKILDSNLRLNMRLCCSVIMGNIGSGKSSMIEKLRGSLIESPYFVYSETVKGKTLKGKTTDSLQKHFATILMKLVSHQPAILFIDDLEVLCENVIENDGQAQSALYSNRISEMLYILLTTFTSNHMVGVIATTNSVDRLNKNIYSARGAYLFNDVFQISELTKENRKEIMEYFLKEYNTEVDLYNYLAEKTSGYVFQDLSDLARKIIFQSIKDDPENRMVIKHEHCKEAMSQMTILALTDVKLHSPGDKDFSCIGGMENIKKLLIETLLWPLKYPNLFDNSPLRLQSGLLLYGPPGTGKTLIAAAAAKQCGVRLISIKGPELLSKYIGASEQAVRDVFLQAQNAKPCILFFDEFDSLAPRRGHDITGVTDRVVNQLLTQMDGVESLNGVCVLAATSRPDLLDPALLRPGRLDKKLLCALPDCKSRLDILKVLSKPLNLSSDVKFKEIAEKTDGFSGADLQSLLYNAQVTTVEHLILSPDSKVEEEIKPISQEILRTSLSKTKPSLSVAERLKYENIYSKFQGKDVGNQIVKPGTRASLA